MILIGPSDVDYFGSVIKNIRSLLEEYNRSKFFDFLSRNAKFQGAHNLSILEGINNLTFWNDTLPKMLEYACDQNKQKGISSCIEVLIAKRGYLT